MKARSILVLVSWVSVSMASFSGCSIRFGAEDDGGGVFSDPGVVPGPRTPAEDAPAFPPPTGVSGQLGAPCKNDSDCLGVLNCLGAQVDDPIFGGGPAGGFCTKACDNNNDCPGSNSACLKNGAAESGRCTLTCSIGPSLENLDQQRAPDKCRGRADLRCDKVKNIGTVCLPTCGKDSQCGPDRVCDPRLAVCVAKASTGLPMGASCDLSASPTSCAGTCIPFLDASVTSCSRPCVLGGAPESSLNCGGPDVGICSFHPVENGAGDFGYCSPSCKSHSECQTNPNFWCFTVPAFKEASGGRGYCFSASPCKTQSDCEQVKAGYVCTTTPKGNFCLDPAF